MKPRKKEKKNKRPRQDAKEVSHQTKRKLGEEGYDPYDFTSSESEGEESTMPPESHDPEVAMETGPAQLSGERSEYSDTRCL